MDTQAAVSDAAAFTHDQRLEQTPGRNSRSSSIVRTPSPALSSNPRGSSDRASPASPIEIKDDRISVLDPRRFTPTLHASLVAEILSLRRDIESKNDFIYNLEATLQQSKTDNDVLNGNLTNNAKEKRSLQRKLQLLEGGTTSAIETLAKERDEANASIVEIKKRLDVYQKKTRHQEEDAQRAQELWERDKEHWNTDRRTLEQKLHISEGRLKAIVEEINAQQLHGQFLHSHAGAEAGEPIGKFGPDLGQAPETASLRSVGSSPVRRSSSASVISEKENYTSRFSLATALYASEGNQLSGLSLADELSCSENEEDLGDDHEDHQMQSPAKRLRDSRQWYPSTPPAGVEEVQHHKIYTDTGIQFSPPPSPKSIGHSIPSPVESNTAEVRSTGVGGVIDESSTHDSRDGEALNSPKAALESVASVSCQTADARTVVMTSSQTQTDELKGEPLETRKQRHSLPQMESVAVQTEETGFLIGQAHATRPSPLSIPSIAVHPPLSSPTSPEEYLLPPQYKSFGCQADRPSVTSYTSSYAQTDIIRVRDGRVKLPPHLLPSAISSKPPTPVPEEKRQSRSFTPIPGHLPAKGTKKSILSLSSRMLPSSPPSLPLEKQERYSGITINDRGLLSNDSLPSQRSSFRSSSLFAAFEAPSSDDACDFFEVDSSDNEFPTVLSAPKHYLKGSHSDKVPNWDVPRTRSETHDNEGHDDPSTLIKADISAIQRAPFEDLLNLEATKSTGKYGPVVRKNNYTQPGQRSQGMSLQPEKRPGINNKGNDGLGSFRGTNEHAPPIPVPKRSSSRVPAASLSDRASPTPTHGRLFAARRRGSGEANNFSGNRLKNLRSVTGLSESEMDQQSNSLSPTSLPSPSVASSSPQLPPLPKDEVTYPRNGRKSSHGPLHQRQPSNNTSTTGQRSVEGSSQQTGQTGVVDAIAQTMVGEWMWKYVRRRKSFGGADTSAGDGRMGDAHVGSNGLRHKRWVWLAPYERSVMWSSKQPVSGAALMGKSGRKLVIQSVLDVKDDSPPPKDAGTEHLFNRSILILTPARALKFTAVSQERHYIWLTALSFLSHSSQTGTEIARIPPIPKQEIPAPPKAQTATLRRNPIRDSIRIAKNKTRPLPAARNRTLQMPIQESEETPAPGSAHEQPIPDAADAADPPFVPRFSKHGRKRSTTGSNIPPLPPLPHHPTAPFRNFSYSPNPTLRPTTSSSEAHRPPSFGTTTSGRQSFFSARKLSDASDFAEQAPTGNFFEAIGTMRMEAFVQTTTGGLPPPSSGAGTASTQDDMASAKYRRGHLRRTRESQGYEYPDNVEFDVHRDLSMADPFRGF